MKIRATVRNSAAHHSAEVSSDNNSRNVDVPAKSPGRGSSVNGGEFLMLALATCYCNDLFREADRLGVEINAVEIVAEADFPGIGLAAENIRYSARIDSASPQNLILQLIAETDKVAEVHNTLRSGVPVVLSEWSAG